MIKLYELKTVVFDMAFQQFAVVERRKKKKSLRLHASRVTLTASHIRVYMLPRFLNDDNDGENGMTVRISRIPG